MKTKHRIKFEVNSPSRNPKGVLEQERNARCLFFRLICFIGCMRVVGTLLPIHRKHNKSRSAGLPVTKKTKEQKATHISGQSAALLRTWSVCLNGRGKAPMPALLLYLDIQVKAWAALPLMAFATRVRSMKLKQHRRPSIKAAGRWACRHG